jgi:hypothetical protein
MIGLLLAMYPARWRQRYAEEFRAVLESRPLGPFDVADVVLGAVDARLRVPRSINVSINLGGHLVLLRIGGLGAILGGVLWFLGIAVGSALGTPDGVPWIVVAMAGNVGLLLALIGLSSFQAHKEPRLAWAAFVIPMVGSVVALIGMLGMVTRPSDLPYIADWSPWAVWILGVLALLVGSVLFAIATIRAAVLSRRAAQCLAIAAGTIVVAASGIGGVAGPDGSRLFAALSLAAFAGSWAWLGTSALRRGPIRAIAPA